MQDVQIIKEIDGSPEDCRRIALEIGSDTSRETLPVRVFSQGPRKMVSGVLPVRVLVRLLSHNSASKGSTAAKAVTALNRPVDSKHVESIAQYLLDGIAEGRPYILPPLTLNATKGLEVYIPRGMAGPLSGWAVLPEDQRITVTDGQHRFLAIQRVRDKLLGTEAGDRFLSDGITVMITLSSDLEQVHQDFADAAKTKPLPPSLVAVYDVRHPGSRAVIRLIEKVGLFHDRIDATSPTLSILSSYVFLANQIRQFVKSSLTGHPALTDEVFQTQANAALSDPKAFDNWVGSMIIYMEVLTELIPEWKEIASLPKPGGPEGHLVLIRMKEIRSRQPVSMSAAALNALGLVAHRILTPMMSGGNLPDRDHLQARLQPLARVDWSRSGELWQGNIVQEGLIKTQNSAVRGAAEKLLEILGANGY